MGPVMPRLEARRLLVGQLLKDEVVHGASSFCGFWGRLVIPPAAHLVHLLIFRVVEAAARARLSQQHFCQAAQEDTSQTTVQDHVPAQPGEVSIVLNKIKDPVRLHEQNHFVSHTCHQPGVHPEERTVVVALSVSIKIAQRPFIRGSLGPKALKYESFEGKTPKS